MALLLNSSFIHSEYRLGPPGRVRAVPRHRRRGQPHVAPVVTAFLDAYPEVSAELSLEDRTVDLIEEGIDVAVRIGHLGSSSLIARRVGGVRRVVVASPGYLARRGTPAEPGDLHGHEIVLHVSRAAGAEWRVAPPRGGPAPAGGGG